MVEIILTSLNFCTASEQNCEAAADLSTESEVNSASTHTGRAQDFLGRIQVEGVLGGAMDLISLQSRD